MLDHVRIVLMHTSHPGNIGAVARAMKNMGLSRLYLVNPKHFPSDEATRRASGADDILAQACVVPDFQAATEGVITVFGTSARGRRIPWPVMNPRDCADRIHDTVKADFSNRDELVPEVAIVFGQEDRGLSNEELQMCNLHLSIPANQEYSSLNLAMAVQVVCYELRMKYLFELEKRGVDTHVEPMMGPGYSGWDEMPATKGEVEGLISHFEQAAIQLDFLDPENPKQLVPRFRRMIQRIQMDKNEVNIMRGFFKAAMKRHSP